MIRIVPLLLALIVASMATTAFSQAHTPLVPVPAAGLTVLKSYPVGHADTPAPVQPSEAAPYAVPQPPSGQPEHARLRPWTTRTAIGPATRTLMEDQASGAQAAPALPTLGAAAGRSWKRYLDSFDHPLPDRFEESVKAK
ncbi:DUF3613 domain-containing protein [Castellaniella sp.]|uniref:DUF3613 domain-containing protein n=1 Tax=Castellaniella sp. TaxID=1955812 RepID=UPI003C770038